MIINFSYVIENTLAGCAHPDSFGDVKSALTELHAQGIRVLVSLDEEGISPNTAAEHGIDYLHIPIPDFQPPQMNQAEEFVKFIADKQAAGKPVAVHCQSGMGRTGTLMACYLVSQGKTAEEAITEVRRCRPGSIETRGQERFIRDFEVEMRRKNPELDRRGRARE